VVNLYALSTFSSVDNCTVQRFDLDGAATRKSSNE